MTHESTSERRVSRRSLRARRSSFWLRFSRFYSVSAGIAVATILVFMSTGVIPFPNMAKADHVGGDNCKQYTNAHPPDFDYRNNVGIFDAEYRRLCYMDNEKLRELEDTLVYAATGVDPSGAEFGGAGGFQITPEQARSIGLRAARGSSSITGGLAKSGAGKVSSAFNGLLRVLLPDGTIAPGGVRLPFKGTLDGSGGGSMTWKNSQGTTVGQGVVLSAKVTNGVAQVKLSTSGSYSYAGEVMIRCAGSNSYPLDRFVDMGLTLIETPVTIRYGDCRFATADRQDNVQLRVPEDIKYFGPVLSANSATATPETYNLSEVGAPERLTADPPQGDTVVPPHETRILYDDLTNDPEYKPRAPAEVFPEPPPGVDAEQWEQHQRRIRELTPPHGAPYGDPNYRINEDGSLTTRFADGTELTTWPDLTELVESPAGKQNWRYTDGIKREVGPDGTETTTYPDGTQVVTAPGAAPQWSRPPSPGTQPEPIPAPSAQQYPPPPSGNYSPPPPSPGDTPGCSAPVKPRFIMPYVSFGEKFPFSLVISAKEGLQSFVGTPRAPKFDLPLVGVIDMARWEGAAGVMRNFLWFVIGAILMPIFFYTLIKGKE